MGQLITSIPTKVELQELRENLNNVIQNQASLENEFQVGGKVFLMRIIPYYSDNNRVSGAILVFQDKTDLHKIEDLLREENIDLHKQLKDTEEGSTK
jgi:sensor histidine kinase regulating citrate/malate metabolism